MDSAIREMKGFRFFFVNKLVGRMFMLERMNNFSTGRL